MVSAMLPYFRAAFFLAATVALVMASLPHPPPIPGQPSDKFLHMLAFATLGGLAAIAFPLRSLTWLLLALTTFGASIEVIQAIPFLNRDSDVVDLAFDVVAALAGLWIVRRLLPPNGD